jgi:hypothetical protein
MGNIIQKYIQIDRRKKIYLVLLFISLVLLFFSTWQVRPVIVEVKASFGLAPYLPILYWLGLAFLVTNSVLIFFDSEIKNDYIFIAVLLTLGLFLIGLAAFVFENPSENAGYYPFSEINNWFPLHHIDITNNQSVISYYSWPGFHFVSAFIIEITKIDFLNLAKYWPIFWAIILVFITYGTGKRLGMSPNHCFLLSFLVITSWMLVCEYSPRILAMTLFLLLFMLLLSPKKTVTNIIIVILLFFAIVLTHPITTLAALPAVVLVSIYKKNYQFVLLFMSIFIAWYIYQALFIIGAGIKDFMTYPLNSILSLINKEANQWGASTARIISHTVWLTYASLYVVMILGSVFLLLRRKIKENRKQLYFIFIWLFGVTSTLLVIGLQDAVQRSYIFGLFPAACIIVLSIPKHKIFGIFTVVIMCIFAALYIPAEYGDEVSWQVLTSHLKGLEFLTVKLVQPGESYYYESHQSGLVGYFNPNIITSGTQRSNFFARLVGESDDPLAQDESTFVCVNKKSRDLWLFSWGYDPYDDWPNSEIGKMADLFYDNGSFQIYKNRLIESSNK